MGTLKTPVHLHAGRFLCDAENTPIADARVENDPRMKEIVEQANRFSELLAAAEGLRHQVEQMRGLFRDDDGAIEAACSEFDALVEVR